MTTSTSTNLTDQDRHVLHGACLLLDLPLDGWAIDTSSPELTELGTTLYQFLRVTPEGTLRLECEQDGEGTAVRQRIGWAKAPEAEAIPVELLPRPTMDTPPGTRVQVSELRGYVLHQDRPGPCKTWAPLPDSGRYSMSCRCGKCDGTTVTFAATVERAIYWADNSREVIVKDDAGETHIVRLAAPSGDVC